MRHIDQRVTMRCELRPLTKEDVAGYVAHRLAMAGGTRERVAFANAAIEMIHAASNGLPRLVNVICDRALALGYLERTSVIGPSVVADAIDHLHMRPLDAAPGGPMDVGLAAPSSPPAYEEARVEPQYKAPVVEQRSPSPRESTDAAPVRGGASTPAFDLDALLHMPATAPRRESAAADDQDHSTASHAQTWRARVDREARRESRFTLKVAGLAVLGIAVMLIAGGVAVMAQRSRPVGASLGASSAASAPREAATPNAIGQPAAAAAPSGAAAAVPVAAPVSAAAQGSWIVQVAAFSGPQRAQATVERLAQAGLPAFEVATDSPSRGVLYFVRVGPFKTSAEAEAALGGVRKFSDLDGAFVRSVSSNQ
jgi:cell division septation protein DedD